ncbi:MAG: hypothetical protein V1908_01050 [Candidatus Peregrinibacteria bacterium]
MTLSIFIARLLALIYLSAGLGMILNRDNYQKMMERFTEEAMALYIGGFMALAAGFALVTYHNIWDGTWVALVSLIGWLAMIKGVIILVFPKLMISIMNSWFTTNRLPALGGFVLLLGLVLGYFGFVA